jgi:CBS-domain-containing membrane protein
MLAKDVMTTDVVTVSPDTEIHEIARLLLERRISAVPVVDGARSVLGIVSEGDLIDRPESQTRHGRSWWLELFSDVEDRARAYLREHGTCAKDVMTAEVVTVTEDAPLSDVAAVLERRRIKRVPVVREGRLVGIVSRANLLQGLAAWRPEESSVKPSDREIREAVRKAIGEAGLSLHLVNVIVADGGVQLWGAVESEVERQAARAAVEQTPGVKSLSENLYLVPPRLRAAWGGA